MLDAGANRIEWQPLDCGDGHRMVAFVDPQEADLHLDTADRFVDVVREAGIEYGVVVAAHLVGLLGGDRHMTETCRAGDESTAVRHMQRSAICVCPGKDLLGKAIGPRETDQPFHTAQRGFLGGAFGDWYPVSSDARNDFVEGVVVVEVPSESGDILSGAALQQETALVVVEAKTHHIGQCLVDVHADGVAAETPPVSELLRLDDDVAEVDIAEHARHE